MLIFVDRFDKGIKTNLYKKEYIVLLGMEKILR